MIRPLQQYTYGCNIACRAFRTVGCSAGDVPPGYRSMNEPAASRPGHEEAAMKVILISRHVGGSSVHEEAAAQNLKDMTEWVTLLNASVAMPIRGGVTVSAKDVRDYSGDLGGLLIFEAESPDHALALVKKSPGLKYGFT